jgi:hypothetical protein
MVRKNGMNRSDSATVRAIVPTLVAVAMTGATFALLGVDVSIPLLIAAFGGTIVIYILDRTIWAGPEDGVGRNDLRGIDIVAVCLGAFLVGVAAPLLAPLTLLLGAGLALLAAAYSLPIFGGRLKEAGQGKPLIVAAGWAAGAVIIPAIESGQSSILVVMLLVAYRTAFILPNTLFADLPDAPFDRHAEVVTPATMQSRAGLRDLAIVSVTSALALAFVAFFGEFTSELIILDAAGLMVILAIINSRAAPPVLAHRLDLAMLWPALTCVTLLL